MKTLFKCVFALSFVLLISLTTGCASIVKGTTQAVPITSDPIGADVFLDGNLVGTTPSSIEMRRKTDHLVTVDKQDYNPKSVAIIRSIGGAVWGNILIGGLIGWGGGRYCHWSAI